MFVFFTVYTNRTAIFEERSHVVWYIVTNIWGTYVTFIFDIEDSSSTLKMEAAGFS
jgi:hypothetical protein